LWLEPLENRTLPSFGFGWAFSVGGTGQDVGKAITTDGSGNLYVTGWFLSSTVNFDPNHTNPSNPNNTLPNANPGTSNLQFIAKYTSNKTFQWVTNLGTSNEFSGAIAIDGAGNVYAAHVDPSTNNTTNAFKLDASSGTVRWKVPLPGSSASDPGGPHTGVAVGPSGDVYVTGRNASRQAFVAKLDPSANVLWNQPIGGSSTEGLAVAVDSGERVYVAFATVTTPPPPKKNAPPPPPIYNIQVARLNAASGSTLWGGSMGSYGNSGAGIAVDGAGNVYVAGGGSPYFVAKLVPSNNGSLTQSWSEQFSGNDWASGVAVDVAGNVYTTGSFQGPVDFDPGPGTYILQGAGLDDIFVSELNANGNFVAAADIVTGVPPDNPQSAEYGHGIALDSSGNIYTTGGFRGTADFNPTGTYDLTSNGAQDVFVSQMTQSLIGGSAAAPSSPHTGRELAVLLASSPISLARFVESSTPIQAAGEGGAWLGQTKILPVTQEALGIRQETAESTMPVHLALLSTTPPAVMDRLFADLVNRALAHTVAADASLALLA
jgi:hypothetical protein